MDKKYKLEIRGETFYADADMIDILYELVVILEQKQKIEEKLAAFMICNG